MSVSVSPQREEIIEEFHRVFSHPINVEWTTGLLQLRAKLLSEECQEIMEELFDYEKEVWIEPSKVSKSRLLKEMADVQVVLSGMAVALGLPLEEAFQRTHKSNMSKLLDDGTPLKREDGKILKGPNYVPPIMDDLV